MKVSEILENERAQSDPDVQNIPVSEEFCSKQNSRFSSVKCVKRSYCSSSYWYFSEEFCSKQNSRFSSVKCDTYGVKIVHGGERGSKSNLKLYIIFPQ